MTEANRGPKIPKTRGTGLASSEKLGGCGRSTVIEDGTRIFFPHNIFIGDRVFIGHDTQLDGYHAGNIRIGDGTWIGAFCFLHGAGGLAIGRDVGLGPRVTILTSEHELSGDEPIIHRPLRFAPVVIGDGADIGCGAIVLPGVTVGPGAVVGAGAVVTRDVPALAVAAGNPARILRRRDGAEK